MDEDLKRKIGNDLCDQLAGLFLGWIVIMILGLPCWIMCC